jgi:poly(3-hydroxybutyrate) depolymerase
VPEAVANATDGRKVPLIVDMHGGGGCALHNFQSSAFKSLADTEAAAGGGIIVAYPQGNSQGKVSNLWATIGSCPGHCQAKKTATLQTGKAIAEWDDVGFLEQLVVTMVKTSPYKDKIDAERVYVSGFSNGCMMAHRFAVERSKIVAALGCGGGDLTYAPTTKAEMDADKVALDIQPMPAYLTIGSADGWYAGAQTSWKAWSYWNECQSNATTSLQTGSYNSDKHLSTDCANTTQTSGSKFSAETVMLVMGGMGHAPFQAADQRQWNFMKKFKRVGALAELLAVTTTTAMPTSSASATLSGTKDPGYTGTKDPSYTGTKDPGYTGGTGTCESAVVSDKDSKCWVKLTSGVYTTCKASAEYPNCACTTTNCNCAAYSANCGKGSDKGSGTTTGKGPSTGTFQFDHTWQGVKKQRSYLLAKPTGTCSLQGLVVVIAPEGGNCFSLGSLADTMCILVACPYSQGSWKAFHGSGDSEDVDFVAALIPSLLRSHGKTPLDDVWGNVIVTGFSAGGSMSYRIGCERSDVVGGLVLYGQTFFEPASGHVQKGADISGMTITEQALQMMAAARQTSNKCDPQFKRPHYAVVGTQDNYYGEAAGAYKGKALWERYSTTVLNCTGTPAAGDPAVAQAITGQASSVCTQYASCSGLGSSLNKYCTVTGMGHDTNGWDHFTKKAFASFFQTTTTSSEGTSATATTSTSTTTTAWLDTSKLAGTATFHVSPADVDLIVNNQSRKDAMKEGFAAAIMVKVSTFTKFEVTKVVRRLGVEQETFVRQLVTVPDHNINVAYTIDLTGVASKTKIATDAKALTKAALQQKVEEKLTAVGYTGTIEARSFTAVHPTLIVTTSARTTSGAVSQNMWLAALVALFISFVHL